MCLNGPFDLFKPIRKSKRFITDFVACLIRLIRKSLSNSERSGPCMFFDNPLGFPLYFGSYRLFVFKSSNISNDPRYSVFRYLQSTVRQSPKCNSFINSSGILQGIRLSVLLVPLIIEPPAFSFEATKRADDITLYGHQ